MLQLAKVEFAELFTDDYDETKIDWEAVRVRIRRCVIDAGMTFHDIAEFVGLDMDDENYMEKYKRLPKLKTALAVATFIGVPGAWVLTGRGTPDIKKQSDLTPVSKSIGDVKESTIVQGNNSGTMIITTNSADPLSGQKRELLRIYDTLPIREQTRLLHLAYSIEDEIKVHK